MSADKPLPFLEALATIGAAAETLRRQGILDDLNNHRIAQALIVLGLDTSASADSSEGRKS